MNFIILHTKHTNEIIFINIEHIISMKGRIDNKGIKYTIIYTSTYNIKVKETVLEILKQLNERNNNNEQM